LNTYRLNVFKNFIKYALYIYIYSHPPGFGNYSTWAYLICTCGVVLLISCRGRCHSGKGNCINVFSRPVALVAPRCVGWVQYKNGLMAKTSK